VGRPTSERPERRRKKKEKGATPLKTNGKEAEKISGGRKISAPARGRDHLGKGQKIAMKDVRGNKGGQFVNKTGRRTPPRKEKSV